VDLLRERRVFGPCMLAAALAASIPALAGCTSGPQKLPEPAQPIPVAVEVNQSRDQYGKQAIQLLLTNMSGRPLNVAAARLTSTLFQGDILWKPGGGGLELPPNQPKSLPVRLPAPVCRNDSAAQQPVARVKYSEPGDAGLREVAPAAVDPFGVLERNNTELCLAADAAAVADIVLGRSLEVAPDGDTGVVRLVITPKKTGRAGNAAGTPITLDRIDGTTLLAEPADRPWPRGVRIVQGAGRSELSLRIRPARCDPHAVAEDKVGTLLPLHVSVGGRQGLLKIAAGAELRAEIYDFVAAACTPNLPG
jgi:hypothetical protein